MCKDGNALALGTIWASRETVLRCSVVAVRCIIFVLVMPLYVGLCVTGDERRKCEKLNMDTSVCGGGCRSVAVAFFD